MTNQPEKHWTVEALWHVASGDGVSLPELSRRTGISTATLGNWRWTRGNKTGRTHSPRIKDLEKALGALGLDLVLRSQKSGRVIGEAGVKRTIEKATL